MDVQPEWGEDGGEGWKGKDWGKKGLGGGGGALMGLCGVSVGGGGRKQGGEAHSQHFSCHTCKMVSGDFAEEKRGESRPFPP